jgi:hypothetical protein
MGSKASSESRDTPPPINQNVDEKKAWPSVDQSDMVETLGKREIFQNSSDVILKNVDIYDTIMICGKKDGICRVVDRNDSSNTKSNIVPDLTNKKTAATSSVLTNKTNIVPELTNKRIEDGATFSLQSVGGQNGVRYCTAEPDRIVCNSVKIGENEKFRLIRHHNNTGAYVLQSAGGSNNGKFCANTKDDKIICNRDKIGPWETYNLHPRRNGEYILQAADGPGGRKGYCESVQDRIRCNGRDQTIGATYNMNIV